MFAPDFRAVFTIDRLDYGQALMMTRLDEPHELLHERLRPQVVSNTSAAAGPTEILTRSWRTLDVSRILGIENAVAVMTSNCCHEFNKFGDFVVPFQTIVGVRDRDDWMQDGPTEGSFRYRLQALGRPITEMEANAIYDASRA